MTGQAAADRVAGLSREQRVLLLERLRRQKERAEAAPNRIQRRPPHLHPLPASFAQERLWFLDRLEPGGSAYNIPLALRIRGAVSPAALAAILGEVVRRHEAVRTTFREHAGHPVQEIAPPGRWELPLVDLADLPGALRDIETRRLAREEAVRPFDLARGPLLRASLLRLDEGEHALLLSMHHIVSDGWSMQVIVREITALYGALLTGRPSPLPELPIQYADFAVWQRSWLRGEVLESQLSYWRERLAGVPASLDLPFDRPRPAVPTSRGARLAVPFATNLSRALERLARRSEATLFMVLLAAFQALLCRISGQDDIPVGSPIANRNRAEIGPLIGFFVNTLVLRADLSDDPPFRDLLAQVRRTTLEAYTHQDLPFERLVDELRPARHLSVNPLFQVMLAVQNAPAGRMDLPGLSLAPVEIEAAPAVTFDLELTFWERESGLLAVLSHSSALFDSPTVLRLASQLETLLRGFVEDDGRRISELPLLPESARHQLLVEWNDTGRVEEPRSVVERFAAQAALSPAAVALEAAGEVLTYGDLDHQADRFARRLRRLGVGPGSVVGLLAERSAEMVAGLLGVWKAGGAWLPLDPGHPPARLAMLLEDSQVRVIAAHGLLADRLPPHGADVVLLDASAGEDLEAESGKVSAGSARPAGPPAAGDLACLIYTSGSTGRPKAVQVEHGNLASTLAAVQRAFGFGPADRLPSIASFSFDIFLFELLGPLLAGGTCVLLPLYPTLDLERLVDELELGRATCLHAVPAVMRQVVELARRRAASAPRLCALFTGGDTVPADLLADLRETFPRARIHVLYGPTETAIACTTWPVPVAAPDRPLLGRPFDGVEIRLCDAAGNLVPIGVPGEIWIVGAGVTRGYWRRAELTAERFVEEDGRRFFRSGDRARRLADGTLEFLGRADEQVKVRGFRIELGEVEAALLRHPEVAEAVAAAREGMAGKQLVAYAVVRDPERGSAAALRRFLQGELPAYMVPSAVVVLDRLPLNVHDKVDRAALPDPEPARGAGEAGTPPQTPTEETMAALWREVLAVEHLRLEDNFFELGGHSLLATQLVSRVRSTFGVDLPLRRLFEHPTLGDLAAALGREIAWREEPIPPRKVSEAPLSAFQERMWRFEKQRPGTSAYNISSAHLLRGPLDAELVERCLAEVIRRQGALRTRIIERDGAAVQVVEPAVPFHLTRIDLDGIPPSERRAEAARLGVQEGSTPFDLHRAPTLRAALIRLGAEEHALFISCHHLLSDGWSMGVLVTELAALYRAFGAGEPSPLPELPIQFTDYVLWQRERLAGPALDGQLAWWLAELRGCRALDLHLDLHLDRPRPPVRVRLGRSAFGLLPAGLVEGLRELGRGESASLFMSLLAAFELLIGRWTGQEEFLVGSPVAGRGRAELEPLIGYFVNLLPLRADLSGQPTFRELLRRVRTNALEAFARPDVPFARLAEATGMDRDPSRPPLVQVGINLLSFPSSAGELPGGLRLEPLAAAQVDPRYDLGIYAWETAEGLGLHLTYDGALFVPARMDELLRQYRHILEQAVHDPDLRISTLSLSAEGR